MEEMTGTSEKIKQARKALEDLANKTPAKQSGKINLVLELKGEISRLIEAGVSKNSICTELKKIGVKITPWLIEKYIIEEKSGLKKETDIEAAKKALNAMSQSIEVKDCKTAPAAIFLAENKDVIKGLHKKGWSVARIIAELKKHGVTCAPQTLKKYVGISIKKRSKTTQNKVSNAKSKIPAGNTFAEGVTGTTQNSNMSDINPSFRNNETTGKYFKK